MIIAEKQEYPLAWFTDQQMTQTRNKKEIFLKIYKEIDEIKNNTIIIGRGR